MATCLAYRSDDCSSKTRLRNLDDIREISRQETLRIRSYSKCLKMLSNRSTLIKYLNSEDDCDSIDTLIGDQIDGATSSSSDTYSVNTDSCWGDYQCLSPVRQDTSSPFPSSSSSYSSRPSTPDYRWTSESETAQLPSYFFEKPSKYKYRIRGHPAATRSVTVDLQTGREIERSTQRGFRDIYQIQSDYLSLEEVLVASSLDSASRLVADNWKIILDAINSTDEAVPRSVNMLKMFSQRGSLQADTVLNLLQHGLLINLRSSINTSKLQPGQAYDLLLSICRSIPSAIPYMIDLMATSALYKDIIEFIATGDKFLVETTIEFLHQLGEMLMSQLMEPSQQQIPLLPKILIATGVSAQTLDSYSVLTTLTKLYRPDVVFTVAKSCLTRSYSRNEAMISRVLHFLANALKLAHLKSSRSSQVNGKETEWIVRLLIAFKDCDVSKSLRSMCNAWSRTIQSAQSSEHSSQGIGVDDPARRLISQSEQFMEFYQQCFGNLSSKYLVNNIDKREEGRYFNDTTPVPSSQESTSSIFDGHW